MERQLYTACSIEGPNLIAVSRCATCGELAIVEPPPSTRVQGRLPERCIKEHGNMSVLLFVEVPPLDKARAQPLG